MEALKRNYVLLSLMVFAVLAIQTGYGALVAHWPLDDLQGTTAKSAVNSPADDGTLVDTAVFISGEVTKGAVWMDGTNDYITTAFPGILGSAPRSVSAWFKIPAGRTGDVIVSWGSSWTNDNGGPGKRFTLKVNNDSGVLKIETGSANAEVIGTSEVTDGQWHHVAVTLPDGDMANAKMYIDGVPEMFGRVTNSVTVNTGGTIGAFGTNSSAVHIGAVRSRYNFGYLSGSVADVRIYDEVLDEAAVADLAKIRVAHNPVPVNGAEFVAVDTALSWSAVDYDGALYNVYLGTSEPNLAAEGYGLVKLTTEPIAETSFTPPMLANAQRYYWAVDAYEPNDVGYLVHPGPYWSFTTIPAVAVITANPISQTVPAGQTVELSVAALNADVFQWYKDDVPLTDGGRISGTATDTLIITDVQVADEGGYYCVVDNVLHQPATSLTARLMTRRLVAHWKMDGDICDSVSIRTGRPEGDWPGVMNVPGADPNFVAGVDGQGMEFYRGDGLWVTIPNSGEFFNFWPQGLTISLWYNPQDYTGVDGYMSLLSKITSNVGYRLYDTAVYAAQGLEFGYGGGSNYITANGRLDDGAWHLATVTYDGQTFSLYVDGLLRASRDVVLTQVNAEPVTLGATPASAGQWQYRGLMDDVRIYSYALSRYEVADLYLELSEAERLCLEADSPTLRFDFNDDCVVNLADFAIFAADWLNCQIYPDCLP